MKSEKVFLWSWSHASLKRSQTIANDCTQLFPRLSKNCLPTYDCRRSFAIIWKRDVTAGKMCGEKRYDQKKKKRKQVIWRKRKNDSFLPFVIFVITSYLGHNKNIMQRSCNHGYRKENRLLLFPAITESKENLRKLTFVGKMAAAGYVTQGCFVSNLMILWRDNLTKRCFIKHRLLCNRS